MAAFLGVWTLLFPPASVAAPQPLLSDSREEGEQWGMRGLHTAVCEFVIRVWGGAVGGLGWPGIRYELQGTQRGRESGGGRHVGM